MKRFLCSEHSYKIKDTKKPISFSDKECSFCRYENRPWTIKDIAVSLENAAISMKYAFDDPYSDPFGFSFLPELEEAMVAFLKVIESSYRDRLLEKFNKTAPPKESIGSNGHYTLSSEDFDRLLEDLNDDEPNHAITKARERFLEIKSKHTKT